MAYGLLLLRVVLGGTMAAHGAQKLFGWWGGGGLDGTRRWLVGMRFRGARAMVAMLVGAELGGGILLVLGLVTPFAALAVVSAMFVAIATVHWSKGFWDTDGGYEFNVLIAAAAAAFAAAGPGRFSVDRALGIDGSLSGAWWCAGVLAASALTAGALLTLGRRPAPRPATARHDRKTLRAA